MPIVYILTVYIFFNLWIWPSLQPQRLYFYFFTTSFIRTRSRYPPKFFLSVKVESIYLFLCCRSPGAQICYTKRWESYFNNFAFWFCDCTLEHLMYLIIFKKCWQYIVVILSCCYSTLSKKKQQFNIT